MHKRITLPGCITAGALIAIGLNLPVGNASEYEAPPTAAVDWDEVTLTDTDPIDILAEAEPMLCADGVTVTDGSCEVYTPTPPDIGLASGGYKEIDPGEVKPGVANEDEPGWDCRIMGNTRCGVLIEDTWYIVDFIDGLPTTVTARGW